MALAATPTTEPNEISANPFDIPGKFGVRTSKFSFKDCNYLSGAYYTGSFFDYFKYMKDEAGIKENKVKVAYKGHVELFEMHVLGDTSPGGGDNTWRGGSYKDMAAPHKNFHDYHQFMKRIQQEKLWREVSFAFEQTMQRRRTRSEYDGDFDFDKRWDAEPYQERTRKPQMTRVIKLVVEGSFSSGVSPETINEFASFVTAVITLFERNGVLVDLTVNHTGCNFTNRADTIFFISLKVKRPDEYLPPSQILKCLSTVFYRRAVFALITACAEVLGHKVDSGLGTPYKFGKCWERKDNELHIYGVPDHKQQHNIITSLLELFTPPKEKKK